jgi:hypothetical protein
MGQTTLNRKTRISVPSVGIPRFQSIKCPLNNGRAT